MRKTGSNSSMLFVKIVLGLVFALVLMPSNIKSVAILLFGLSILALQFSRKFYFDKKFFFTNSMLYIILTFTLFYSENLDYGLKKLTTMATFAVFPLIFSMINKSEKESLLKKTDTYLWIYIVAVFLFNLVPFLWFWITHYTFSGIIEHFATIVRVDMGKFNIHPIYLSMHCGLAILFSFFLLIKKNSKRAFITLLCIDISLILFFLLYAKKGPLIAFLIVFSLFIAFRRNKQLVKPYLIAVFVLIGLIILIPKTREKFLELVRIETIDNGAPTSTNIRYSIYQEALDLIEDAPVFGYGIGDYKDVLLDKFSKEGGALLVNGRYNSHNQYFSFMVIGGVLVLLAFILTGVINLIYAIRFDNQILILILIFYGINMLTENILEREDGVIFFCLFLNFFSLKSLYVDVEGKE